MSNRFFDDERRGVDCSCILAFLFTGLVNYKGGSPGLLVGRGANLHAIQIVHSTGLEQPAHEPVVHRCHGGFTCKERRHAHHSLL
jgi:hypothetical protein